MAKGKSKPRREERKKPKPRYAWLLPLVLGLPLVSGCAAMKKGASTVASWFSSGGAETVAAAAGALPGIWGQLGMLLAGPVLGYASKKIHEYAGLEEPVSEKPAGLETA